MKKYLFLLLIIFWVMPSWAFPPMPPEVQDETYNSTNFNGDTIHAVSQDDFYDQLHLYDTNDDGDIDTVDVTSLTIIDSAFIPIEWALNGTVAPEAASVITSTYSAVVRNFSAAQTEDVNFTWQVPVDFTGTTIKFQVVGYITNATGPAATEGISCYLAGASIGTGDTLGVTVGTAIESNSTDLNAAGAATQYDIFYTGLSAAVTVTNITAGETVVFKLYRKHDDADDDYGQDVGISGIIVKYSRLLNGTL